MTNTDNVSEEIVIVGSQNGELADVINPLYRQGEPIKESDIRKAIGDNIVYLMPVNNMNDDQTVGVCIARRKSCWAMSGCIRLLL